MHPPPSTPGACGEHAHHGAVPIAGIAEEVEADALPVDQYGIRIWDPTTETLDDSPATRCESIARRAFGVGDDVELTVQSVLAWRMTGLVADRYRGGRIFLAGDAAHAFPHPRRPPAGPDNRNDRRSVAT